MSKNINIAVCGAYGAGRYTMLTSIAKQLEASPTVRTHTVQYSNYMELEGQYGPYSMMFKALYGIVLYKSKAIPKILQDADIVLYVLSTQSRNNTFLPTEYQQHDELRRYISFAKQNNRFISQIPWIWVLSKADLPPDRSFEENLPQGIQSALIRCSFINDIGTEQVLQQILLTHNKNPRV